MRQTSELKNRASAQETEQARERSRQKVSERESEKASVQESEQGETSDAGEVVAAEPASNMCSADYGAWERVSKGVSDRFIERVDG